MGARFKSFYVSFQGLHFMLKNITQYYFVICILSKFEKQITCQVNRITAVVPTPDEKSPRKLYFAEAHATPELIVLVIF
jgi:hypothetical protein